jgi:CelD/BcsL family acetyltransferase involved in cellulose biosynthesis
VTRVVAKTKDGQWVGAGHFVAGNGEASFLGSGPCDYLDLPIRRELSSDTACALQRQLVVQLVRAMPNLRVIRLTRFVESTKTCEHLWSGMPGLYVLQNGSMPAPKMDRASVEHAISRGSIRRHARKLSKSGHVTYEHWTQAEDVLARLDAFFEQHVERWQGGGCPSQFCEPLQREFFIELAREMASIGVLRYTEVHLDGVLAAAHFGFLHQGRFIWYKPAYNPAMAKLSPGVFLLLQLFQRMIEEDAHTFDFTIGDEAFKSRYATSEEKVVDLMVTPSWHRYGYEVLRRRARQTARQFLSAVGIRRGQKTPAALSAALRLIAG